MKKVYLLISLLALLASPLRAEEKDVVAILNGEPLTMRLTEIYISSDVRPAQYFAGDGEEHVQMFFTDADGNNSNLTVHPSVFSVWFNADPLSIGQTPFFDGGEQDGPLTLKGLKPGTDVRVYDMNGRLCLTTKAGRKTRMQLDGLKRGIYVVRAGNVSIKITKK
mgnify:CR=1 FL=1